MQRDDSKSLYREADIRAIVASELSIAAATLESQGDVVVAKALREQVRKHRAKSIQLRARAASEAFLNGPHSDGCEE